jgi:uncharacterized protein YyaL (SSP411 family)
MSDPSSTRAPNRLVHEKSPYLLQHAYNPVDWHPWGPEAFARARQEGKLLLVSIGYATCHWCHVMERESFEDPKLAAFLNAHFVPVKVDREERPDVDKLHMDALHALGQQGGWPLNMFVLPDGRPITGGTYFPPRDLYGRPSFRTVLERLRELWESDREKMDQVAGELHEHLQRNALPRSGTSTVPGWLAEENAFQAYQRTYDPEHGGFRLQPQNKFPPSMGLSLMLRHHRRTHAPEALQMVEHTLQKMLSGGIYDQLGGGLSRYSTDYQWLVPHFEKMLYDNALFVQALLEAFQITRNPTYAEGVRDVLAYVQRDMTHPEGAFFSAEDADSEGVEGKFYVWTPGEVHSVLGSALGRVACAFWDITEAGNFEGHSIPNRPRRLKEVAAEEGLSVEELLQQLGEARQRLLEQRSQRIRPLRDDKVLTSWNALMISACAKASRVLEEPLYIEMAVRAAEFLQRNLMSDSGRLLRRWREGEARYLGYLVDHTQWAVACLDLHEATQDPAWFVAARNTMDTANRLFRHDSGPYFDTGDDAEQLLVRNMEGYDGVEPSGNSAAAQALLRLHALTGDSVYLEDALRIFSGFSEYLEKAGPSFSAMLQALHFHLSEPREVVLIGREDDPEFQEMRRELRQAFHPNLVSVVLRPGEESVVAEQIPLVHGKQMQNNRPTAYVCRGLVCHNPVHSAEALRAELA